jgi:hypothetical protein
MIFHKLTPHHAKKLHELQWEGVSERQYLLFCFFTFPFKVNLKKLLHINILCSTEHTSHLHCPPGQNSQQLHLGKASSYFLMLKDKINDTLCSITTHDFPPL